MLYVQTTSELTHGPKKKKIDLRPTRNFLGPKFDLAVSWRAYGEAEERLEAHQ